MFYNVFLQGCERERGGEREVLASASHPELHHISVNIILQSKMSTPPRTNVFFVEEAAVKSCLFTCTTHTQAQELAPLLFLLDVLTGWSCAICTNTIIHQDEKW